MGNGIVNKYYKIKFMKNEGKINLKNLGLKS